LTGEELERLGSAIREAETRAFLGTWTRKTAKHLPKTRACTHKSRLVTATYVRFGPLCGLKSDISRGPRSAISRLMRGSKQMGDSERCERPFACKVFIVHFLILPSRRCS
jgi:hypothetical protein